MAVVRLPRLRRQSHDDLDSRDRRHGPPPGDWRTDRGCRLWVRRLDGHMSLANAAALAAAGVTSETSDVDGGTIVRDERGEPTGIFKDNAESLVARAVITRVVSSKQPSVRRSK